MRCPFCNYAKTKVLDKRISEEMDVNRRRRECIRCRKRFTTYERIEGTSVIKKIKKRDGRVVNFDKQKVADAIFKAAQSVGGKDKEEAENLADQVVEHLEKGFAGKVPTVEQVQDILERVLVETGHYMTAKAFILYRKQRSDVRDTQAFLSKVGKVIEGYTEYSEPETIEAYSISGLQSHVSGAILADYTLSGIYSEGVRSAAQGSQIYIHDLAYGPYAGHSVGWSLRDIFLAGFNGVKGRTASGPAMHFGSALGQILDFSRCLGQEWASVQSFPSFDTYLAPYVAADRLDYASVRQGLQRFVFVLNQSPVSINVSLSLDMSVPADLADRKAVCKGRQQKEAYADFGKEAGLIDRAMLEIVSEGDMNGKGFAAPTVVAGISKGWEADSRLAPAAGKHRELCFANFLGTGAGMEEMRKFASLRRAQTKTLAKRYAGFAYGEQTGIIGMTTINLPRLGYVSRNEDKLFSRLEQLLVIAKESLEVKRKELEKSRAKLLPWTKRYVPSLDTFFSSVGVVGMNECCLNFLGEGLESESSQRFASKMLDSMNERLLSFQEETGNMYSLDYSTGRAALRLAESDLKRYPKMAVKGRYTAGTNLPGGFKNGLEERIRITSQFIERFNGATHFIASGQEPEESIKKAAGSKIPYFSAS